MAFDTESKYYEKTALSDLQGAWGNLRDAVVESAGFPRWDDLLFHIDEAMSWESVRNLARMRSTLTLIRNIVVQSAAPEEVLEWLEIVTEDLDEAFEAIARGEAR